MPPDAGTGSSPVSEEPREEVVRDDGRSLLLNALTGGVAGVAVTAGLANQGVFWPALTVLAGAAVASGLLLVRRGGQKRYLLAGIVFFLGLALVLEVMGSRFPDAYTDFVLPAAGGFGAISGILVVGKFATKRVVKALARLMASDEEYWAQVWEALAAFGSLLSMAWLLITFSEKVFRYGGATVGAVGLLVANMLDYRVSVEVLGVETDAVLLLFVGCVLMWFHLLDTLHNSWRALAQTAERSEERAQASRKSESPSGTES